ncbi:conserved hypothetical protein [Nostocoides australiense Ben110]|uniref:Uncharacterized protein n=1 Tax=Nostocoides australiense Ben110 TaxID=1193182 RepID=W6K1G2_9MICO|nr:ABC-three component system middle component 2 [Tetrasphaera australiensis]CCH74891.1 conserved hypothetical protein [Tetrasphaera australiensis Ben110]
MPDHSLDLSSPVPQAPDDYQRFRLGQLLLLVAVATEQGKPVHTIDRLGYYDFFAANPFLMLGDSDAGDQKAATEMRLAGFRQKQLSYTAPGARFVNRRERLRHDLALLVSYGLVELSDEGYRITSAGSTVSSQFESVYADSYRTSAALALRRLVPLSDKRLTRVAQSWLGESSLWLDLFADVGDLTTSSTEGHR